MRVLISTGSSGGHIFPALALIEQLQKEGHQVFLILPWKKTQNLELPSGVQFAYIPIVKLDFSLKPENISGGYNYLRGALMGLRIILKFKPEVVVGFGSLQTVALIFWAWLFRIKTIIHEQNVIPGRANRLLAKFVDKVAISFLPTANYLKIFPEKIVFTGNPLRSTLTKIDRDKALEFFKFKSGKINILITGGSQGSAKLNSICFEALASLAGKDNLQIIHIIGNNDTIKVSKQYSDRNLNCRIFNFFPEMQYAYSFADLVISRAGALTIAELQKFSLPAILIPYPFASEHQLANAQVLQDLGQAQIIRDQELTVVTLKERIEEILNTLKNQEIVTKNFAAPKILDAAKLLTQEVLKLNL